MDKQQILKIVVKNINLKGLLVDMVDDVLEEAVRNAVAKSENKLDDHLVNSFYPLVEAELLKLIEEKVDLGNLLGLENDSEA